MKHDFHGYSCYCVKCGAGLDDVENGLRARQCNSGENVVGISHQVRGKRLKLLVKQLIED